MNEAVDLHELTSVIPLPPGATDDQPDERGWWPVLAFTDDVRPVPLAFNLN